mmetsp:Transcript_13542/g.40933  ORF Transcript_13542/g.40933 Transcript_13542/m.40933 type:complete len:204 (+) Transcript_13542:4042-4653(+)
MHQCHIRSLHRVSSFFGSHPHLVVAAGQAVGRVVAGEQEAVRADVIPVRHQCLAQGGRLLQKLALSGKPAEGGHVDGLLAHRHHAHIVAGGLRRLALEVHRHVERHAVVARRLHVCPQADLGRHRRSHLQLLGVLIRAADVLEQTRKAPSDGHRKVAVFEGGGNPLSIGVLTNLIQVGAIDHLVLGAAADTRQADRHQSQCEM